MRQDVATSCYTPLYLVLEGSLITLSFMLLELVKVFSSGEIEIRPFVCGCKTETGDMEKFTWKLLNMLKYI